MIRFLPCLLLVTTTHLMAISELRPEWEKIETNRKVEIYRGKLPDSKVVAFRGVSTIEAPIEKVLSVIYDVSRIKEWMSDVNNVVTLEKKNKFDKIEYNRTNAPWPLQDRDFVYATKVSVNAPDNSVEILVRSTEHPEAPLVEDVIRGELHLSRYYLKAVEDNSKTHIEVEILADPKGSVPKWIVNVFQSAWPVNTVNGIRKLATEEGSEVHPDVADAMAKVIRKKK